MTKKRQERAAAELLSPIAAKLQPPLGIVLGSPREVADLTLALPSSDIINYQMDLHQAGRAEEELRLLGAAARVVTAPDLWDLPTRFQTLVYPAPAKGERALKLDMIEQAYHVLAPGGRCIVLSPYEDEQLFPAAL